MSRHHLRLTAITAVLVVAGALATAGAATAAEQRGVRLLLTVVGDTADASPVPFGRMATLRCRPTGGTHPDAAAVCDRLVVVDGTPYLGGTPLDLMCPLVHRPVTVSVTGTADGQLVDHRRTYSNACVLHSETGPLFEF